MSHYWIRPVNRSCGSYGPGHQMHWIQAKKSWEDEQPMIDVSIVVHHDGHIDLEGDELKLAMWNHDPHRLFSLAALDQRTPCHPGARQAPGESTPDFLARAIREDHGFTVPGRSFLAPDVVEGQE